MVELLIGQFFEFVRWTSQRLWGTGRKNKKSVANAGLGSSTLTPTILFSPSKVIETKETNTMSPTHSFIQFPLLTPFSKGRLVVMTLVRHAVSVRTPPYRHLNVKGSIEWESPHIHSKSV
jgi:hypothetical protein